MSAGLWLAVALGGAVGAPARYLVDRLLATRRPGRFPAGTLLVNLAGSLLLGFLAGLALAGRLPPAVDAGVGTGFCGALTTFSTFSYETVRLVQDGDLLLGTLYVGGSLLLGLLAAAAGVAVGVAL
ncbi:fluoride efflux transporter CrcB [Aciditerrimonas ferrireducens]|uniref:fluoride efflux transporter CrcB n=1 Tax=Aciditerrimonas ferrireducens TaxID=667306 RepID=UPI00200550CA|nr:fluoride efflux transporter CrcB [Aciditerrimonas ferrireducens]MCK4176670.1 fluoride efflux transporter CrcB [Aciditerrimonas ferrireducens]